MLSLIITDVLLLLFMTYGYAFPSRIPLPDPRQPLPSYEYDNSAKTSPFGHGQKGQRPRTVVPRT